MDQNDATRGTSRDLRASRIDGFLREALAGREMSVAALQERARAAGLVDKHQSITDLKPFRSAKRSMGIRSLRVGFGPGAVWFWVLPAPPAPEVTAPVTLQVDVYEVNPSDHAPEIPPCYAENPHGVPPDWAHGVAILQLRPRPSGIPGHRWRLFIEDCRRFVASPWARRAAELGWTADGLFGSQYAPPPEHIGTAGLVWNLAGGQIVQLHRDGAAFVTENGSQRTFHRRPDRAMTFLPWR
jgi:hypothetical protein